MKKILFIFLALLLMIAFTNRVDTKQSFDDNLNNMIGCMDYTYKFNTNVPVNVVFYVTRGNGEDETGLFKRIDTQGGKASTILHCGNNYHVIYSASGYKDYEEDMSVKGFKPIWEESKTITLEKL